MNTIEMVDDTLSVFDAVTLKELDDASLMNRMDLKYVFAVHQLPALLCDLTDVYRVLEVEGNRAQNYESIYYDTEDLDMYYMHHRGELERHKIRFRKYATSGTVFLEVKVKDNRGITDKSRVKCSSTEREVLSQEEDFLHNLTPYDQKKLKPVVRNSFKRITLVNKTEIERITIDFDLKLKNLRNGNEVDFPGLSIAEIKREGVIFHSDMRDSMKTYRIHPMRFSKYCVGVAKTDKSVISNRFRSVIRKIDLIDSEYQMMLIN